MESQEDLSTNDWFAASAERVNSLAALYDAGQYALAIYVAGVSAECLFRAFRRRTGLPPRFDHNLKALSEEAGFPQLIPTRRREAYDSALIRLIVGWENKHRYRSEASMLRWLKARKLDRKIKGSAVKENARRMTVSAAEIFLIGETRWTKQ